MTSQRGAPRTWGAPWSGDCKLIFWKFASVGVGSDMMGMGPFHRKFIYHNSHLKTILHLYTLIGISTHFCTWHDDYAVTAYRNWWQTLGEQSNYNDTEYFRLNFDNDQSNRRMCISTAMLIAILFQHQLHRKTKNVPRNRKHVEHSRKVYWNRPCHAGDFVSSLHVLPWAYFNPGYHCWTKSHGAPVAYVSRLSANLWAVVVANLMI